jgi:outer membrane protein
MKQLKTLLLASSLCLLEQCKPINAQAKTAHVEVNEIISKMPAMLEAQKQLGKIECYL